jgi:pyruvate formate lyase activating enzyme
VVRQSGINFAQIQTVRRESKCLRCTRCQQDVAECPSGAWEQIGRDVTLDNLPGGAEG